MTSLSSIVAIVPAAGSGQRMNIACPKQYLKIGTKTILEHTVDKLLSCEIVGRIVIAISNTDKIFHSLGMASDSRIEVVVGGQYRSDSVLSALNQIKDDQWVMVHDAVRPCVTSDDIHKLVKAVSRYKQSAILALPIVDTVKQVDKNRVVKTVDRDLLWRAVTPQLFLAKELKISLAKAKKDNIILPDEASAIEHSGGRPLLVCGRADNLKITYPEDLSLATFYLYKQSLQQSTP